MDCLLGFIGGGNMSTAVGKAIINKGVLPASKIWVSGPRLHNLQHWADMGVNVTTKNGELFSRCDVIFLGVKPSMLTVAVNDCLNSLPANSDSSSSEKLFISMLAGISLSDVQGEVSRLTRNARVIRIMPNTPMLVGAGACLYTAGDNVSEDQCKLLENLLSSCGINERVPESLIDTLGAMTGCGPAFIFMVIEALADGALKQGAPRATALRLAAQMVMGSGRMVLETGKHPALLKDEVCSAGGSTICGVASLENSGLRAALINAVEASVKRNKELGKK